MLQLSTFIFSVIYHFGQKKNCLRCDFIPRKPVQYRVEYF